MTRRTWVADGLNFLPGAVHDGELEEGVGGLGLLGEIATTKRKRESGRETWAGLVVRTQSKKSKEIVLFGAPVLSSLLFISI
jgi:hypothetical protein